jgi:serine protease Do
MSQSLFIDASTKFGTRRRLTVLVSACAIGALLVGAPIYRGSISALLVQAHAAGGVRQGPVGFADLVAKVKPAVISVRVQIVGNPESMADTASPSAFFQGFDQNKNSQEEITGLGSGFFISADGYAVTNNHVVDHARTVQVRLDNGTSYKARVIGTDPKTDVALIKVDTDKPVPYVKFSNEVPRVGDWVVAVGNPYGLGGTVTAGIVSANGRDIGASAYDDYIQIDAPINKGNSGGPAFNADGDVIGINTAIFSPSGGSVGIGFDIPASTAKAVIADLKAHGHVDHAYLGVQVQALTRELADGLGLQSTDGALVDTVMPDSPASEAGLKPGDVITSVSGESVKASRGLARAIGMMAPDTKVTLNIVRHRQAQKITLALRPLPHKT